MRLAWFLGVAAVLGVGCGRSSHDDDSSADGDADVDAECSDPDHDGFGVGDGCQGDDCDEGNPDRQDGCAADCVGAPEDVGCACDSQPLPCFDADANVANDGVCRAGIKRCEGGTWTFCEGQVLPTEEVCDGLDNDCDGTADEGVTNECGTCGNSCTLDQIGHDDWNVDEEGNGVVLDDEGNLTVTQSSRLQPYLWVASQSDSTVTLIETDSRQQLARYLVTANEGSEQPMSISVTPWSGAVVAVGNYVGEGSRGNTITRIAYGPCPDTDGDGTVRTSLSYDDVYEFGDDDCVLWSETYQRAFQVITWETRIELDGRGDYIWVSAPDANQVYEIAADGQVTGREVDLGFPPSGIVIGPDGMLNVAAEWPATGFARIDTVTLDSTQYATPQGQKLCSLATDIDGNVWIPNDLGSQRWNVDTDEIDNIPQCFGTVAATDTVLWGGWCAHDVTTMSLDIVDQAAYPLPAGNAWGFPYPTVTTTEEVFILDSGSDNVYLMDPMTGDYESIADNIPHPGTCGDPTGVTNFRAVGAPGDYEHLFEGCEGADAAATSWASIVYDADTPPGTSITFSVRVADDVAGLATADALSAGSAPNDASPISLAAANGGEKPAGAVLALRVTLVPSETALPVLRSVGVSHACVLGPE